MLNETHHDPPAPLVGIWQYSHPFSSSAGGWPGGAPRSRAFAVRRLVTPESDGFAGIRQTSATPVVLVSCSCRAMSLPSSWPRLVAAGGFTYDHDHNLQRHAASSRPRGKGGGSRPEATDGGVPRPSRRVDCPSRIRASTEVTVLYTCLLRSPEGYSKWEVERRGPDDVARESGEGEECSHA